MNVEEIKSIFQEFSKLEKIGMCIQYRKYLKTIFPKTKVKQIVYHYSDDKISKFKSNFKDGYAAKRGCSPKAIFFLGQRAKKESFLSKRKYLGRYLINLENPWRFPKNMDRSDKRKSGIKEGIEEALKQKKDGTIFDKIWDNQMFCDVYTVFNPRQIHILGSKKDLHKFKLFLKTKNNIN